MDDDRLQLYVTKRGTVVLRRLPRGEPTPAQEVIRQQFKEAAESVRGKRRTDLPPAAVAVRQRLAGIQIVPRTEEPGWRRVFRAWLREQGYTEGEAEAILVFR